MRLQRERNLRLHEPRPWIITICGSQVRVQLIVAQTKSFWEPRQSKIIGVDLAMWEVKPQRYISHSSVGATGGEGEVECANALSDVDSPSEENIGDCTERWATVFGDDVSDELAERRLKRQ